MLRTLRQTVVPAWTILLRPWTWLMLGYGLLLVVPFTVSWVRGSWGPLDAPLTPIPVVEPSPAPPRGVAFDAPPPTTVEWNTRWRDDASTVALVPGERTGDWPMLERMPRLAKLWMSPPDSLSAEGWRRIGDHAALEVLSLPDVSSPDPVVLEGHPDLARAALARLANLRELDLRGTGGSHRIVLPPLAALEVASLGWGELEENLRTLAAASPRLHTLALETFPGFRFTPPMIEALRRMPGLRLVTVAAGRGAQNEADTIRQTAELRRALPAVTVRRGTYSGFRVFVTGFAALFLGAYVPFIFWLQSGILLATPAGWLLPRRVASHLFWPVAAAALCGGMLVGLARALGAAWTPALALALFVTTLAAYGPAAGDLPGRAASLTGIVTRIDVVVGVGLAATAILAPAVFDRWLVGDVPGVAEALLAVAAAAAAWKIVRIPRLPRILAAAGRSAPPGLTVEVAGVPSAVDGKGARSDVRVRIVDAQVDRQIARPLPRDPAGVGGFAELLGRAQSRTQVPMFVGMMFVMFGAMFVLLPAIFSVGMSARPSAGLAVTMLLMAAWQAAIVGCTLVASQWMQRRSSLSLDFLRPVSRDAYWRGLRRAVARDLVVPAVCGAAVLAGGIAQADGAGGPLVWAVAATVLAGCAVLFHAIVIHLATTRWPLVSVTVVVILCCAALALAFVAVTAALGAKQSGLTIGGGAAATLLAAGFAARAWVVGRLPQREIG